MFIAEVAVTFDRFIKFADLCNAINDPGVYHDPSALLIKLTRQPLCMLVDR